MVSNSKLSKAQKGVRKAIMGMLPKGASIGHGDDITILCVPDGKNTRVYSSVFSADELKFRPKVGEFHALSRWNVDGEKVGLLLPGLWTAKQFLSLEI